jgi:hypothetical protein
MATYGIKQYAIACPNRQCVEDPFSLVLVGVKSSKLSQSMPIHRKTIMLPPRCQQMRNAYPTSNEEVIVSVEGLITALVLLGYR